MCGIARRGSIWVWIAMLGCAEPGTSRPPFVVASCNDGEQNGRETDLDCGGACAGCGLGQRCQTTEDCAAELGCGPAQSCVPHCTDGWTDRDETDTDCGGADCPGCAANRACLTTADCLPELGCSPDRICVDHCLSQRQDRDETGIDCGGARCGPCGLDQGCSTTDDCASELGCSPAGVCVVHCRDGVQDRGETDVDCGGDCPFLCALDQGCTADRHCAVGLHCNPAGRCEDRCANAALDPGESAIDCGGGCDPCPVGASCSSPRDCASGSCSGVCDLGAPLTAEELCALAMVTDPQQDLVRTCGQQPAPRAVVLPAAEELTHQCRPGTWGRRWGERLLEAVADGRRSLDVAQARECLAQARALRLSMPGYQLRASADWRALRDGVCAGFSVGLRSAGQSCVDDWDCAAGLGCHSDAPTVAGSKTCSPRAALGEPCNLEYHRCVAGAYCDAGADHAGTCRAQLAAGQPCATGEECLSGICRDDTDVCQPLVELGAPCTESAECSGTPCAVCRPLVGEGPLVCSLAGGDGEYCRTWDDCASDLGCTGHVCQALPAGATCGPHECAFLVGENLCNDDPECTWEVHAGFGFCVSTDQHLCQPGLSCWSANDCGGGIDEPTCLSRPGCHWLADKQLGAAFCVDALGACTRLPSSGPCLGEPPSGACADGFVCDAAHQCVPPGRQDDPCATDADCDPRFGLRCVALTCQAVCQLAEDCPPGHFCDQRSAALPACVPYATGPCSAAVPCPTDQYCAKPGAHCAIYGDADACATDPECAWADTCTPTEASAAASGACAADLPVGAPAYPDAPSPTRVSGDAAMCASGWVVRVSPTEFQCAVVPSWPAQSCLHSDRANALYLQLVFLFGLVLVRRRHRAP